ncbi:MAG: class II fructose-bisphosphate aldolase [Chloroflexi bacterium]|nr:class II fructose-bisphosphate aldolase [Chloroflexota bacterium]
MSIKNELAKARRERYAVPLYDVFEMQGMEGVMDALADKRAPTIIGIYSPYAALPNCRALAAYVRCRAEETDVPVSLMLDHGASVEQCLQMLSYGFTDVMFDGSKLPLEENIAQTRRVVEAAHAAGAGVEAELGHVGMGDQYESLGGKRIGFTDPKSAGRFVEETGVDFLAIAFGNAHGLYKGEPRLDLELVAEIRQRVNVPLVMHGGTGLSDEQFHGAIAAGISKINFATSIMNAAADNMRQAAANPAASMFDIHAGIRTAYSQWCGRLYDVFGTTGQA